MRLAFPDGHHGVAGELGEVFGPDGTSRVARVDMPSTRASRGEEFDDARIWCGDDPLTRRALSVSARTVRDEDGQLTGAALAYKDVTDLMRALAVKDEFVASVSHELRTPLTSIVGFTQLLLDESDDADLQERHLGIVARNAERLDRLVADLLQTARLDQGALRLARSEVDLAQVVRDCLRSAAATAESASVALEDALPPRLLARVDGQRVAQVVDNLVSNAIKYTPGGGRVRVGLARVGDAVELRVADTGIGIEPADRDRLFLRFFRASSAEERSIQGVGLGLSITKAIVEAHGGRIEVDSDPGVGSTFTVRLPGAAPAQR
jgi:signal transduction histidine kinase